MNCKELFLKLNEYAPIELSYKMNERGHHDNSGIIIDCQNQADKILFCLDLTKSSVAYAIEKGCGIIVTHHPAIYRPIKNLLDEAPVLTCAKNNISVISMHLNLDCAEFGIDHYLAHGLGGRDVKILDVLGDKVGYGRSYTLDKTAGEIFEAYKQEFNTQRAMLYGDKNKRIIKVASFCGAGLGDEEVEIALKNGIDMVVSADIPHHVLLHAVESGLTVISCSHYSSENYGMKKVAEHFCNQLKEKIYFFDDERFA